MTRHLAVALMGALAVPATAAADTPIQALPAPTPVRAWAGTAVLSVQDGASGSYRLSMQRGTAPAQPIPGIAPAGEPFDADIGPGPGGAPVIVFARCAAPDRCRLARTTPAGAPETPIAGSAGRDGFESAPTVWGGRLVFARRYAKGSERVYARPLDASARVRSVRLPGVPARQCEEIQRCRAVTDGTVPELELRGTTLAQNVHFSLATVGICGEGQIRLVDVARRTSRLVAHTICGLSGSSYLGVSLTAANLLYARTCAGDPAGCQNHNTLLYRYGLARRGLATTSRPDLLTGFAALADDRGLEVQAPLTHDGDCTNHVEGTAPPCELALAGPLAFG